MALTPGCPAYRADWFRCTASTCRR